MIAKTTFHSDKILPQHGDTSSVCVRELPVMVFSQISGCISTNREVK